MLVTIEGIDGAGKSTLAGRLARELGAILLREPGGVALAERIRDLVRDPGVDVHPRAEALLFAAARAQLVHATVQPFLAAGRVVLLDRFVDSSLAYQGAGRELGVEEIRALNAFATGGLTPDRTLLLRIDPAAGAARQAGRGDGQDRMERSGEAFFARVAAAYDALAAAEPERFAVLDASRPADAVFEDALRLLRT